MSQSGNGGQIPAPALWYGAGGLIPFTALAVFMHVGPEAWLAHAQFALLAYGAVILSFLGGILWGCSIKGDAPRSLTLLLGISVVPSLMGWLALLMIPSIGLLLLMVGFLLMYMTDRQFSGDGFTPDWYLKLRGPLTLWVTGCLVVAGLS